MKVYEMMTLLNKMPAGSKVIFHALSDKKNKENIHTYDDDASYFEVHFENLCADENGDTVVISTE